MYNVSTCTYTLISALYNADINVYVHLLRGYSELISTA